jgi:hypothetical protein
MSSVTTAPGLIRSPTFKPPQEGYGENQSFRVYVFGSRIHRQYIWLALVLSIVQFVAFKLCYPYPDFISDSYNYIESAQHDLNVNLWPVAYAKFLALIHLISPSDLLLVAVQYVLFQSALLYFFISVKFLYRPSERVARVLFVALICNPLFIYLTNAVLSDALFAVISTVWLTILLWQLRSPNRIGLLIQVLLLSLAFMLRYAALYYPLVAALALLLMRLRAREKLVWMAAPALIIVPFILFTQAETKKYTGTAEFSVFGGWQVANNALYMYGNIQVNPAELPAEMRPLDTMMKRYYQHAPPGYFDFENFPGTFFIKHQESPLKQYRDLYYTKTHPDAWLFKTWGSVSPMYSRYGSWLIQHHPLAFAWDYLWLNSKRYFIPFPEIFKIYNYGDDSVWKTAVAWFRWPSAHVHSISPTLPGSVFYIYPVIFGVLNLYFVGCLMWLGFTRKYKLLAPSFRLALLFVAGYQLLHFVFSVLATPVCIRHHITPMLVLFSFCILLFEFTNKSKLVAKVDPSPETTPYLKPSSQ